MQLDLDALLQCDAACRFVRESNRASGGRWWSLGCETFHGLELSGEGAFEHLADAGLGGRRALSLPDWKQRYLRFACGLKAFASPFGKPEISYVAEDDEVAYFRCLLRTEVLTSASTRGVYLEVEVSANPDNFSLAVVDFEDGGSSSLTFSPDTGAVIDERKVWESPRKVKGMFVQPLNAIGADQKFHGRVGLYLCGGRVAFYRMFGAGGGSEPVAWESTGFVTDVAWAEGRRLTPCIAFRSPGHYEVRTTCVGQMPPPFAPSLPVREQALEWSPLDWEASIAGELD